MIERCGECKGEVRTQCDARFAALVQMMVETTDVAAIARETDQLVEVMTAEEEVVDGMNEFIDGQEAAGCELGIEAIYERVQLEIQLRPWEQVSGSTDQQ